MTTFGSLFCLLLLLDIAGLLLLRFRPHWLDPAFYRFCFRLRQSPPLRAFVQHLKQQMPYQSIAVYYPNHFRLLINAYDRAQQKYQSSEAAWQALNAQLHGPLLKLFLQYADCDSVWSFARLRLQLIRSLFLQNTQAAANMAYPELGCDAPHPALLCAPELWNDYLELLNRLIVSSVFTPLNPRWTPRLFSPQVQGSVRSQLQQAEVLSVVENPEIARDNPALLCAAKCALYEACLTLSPLETAAALSFYSR